MELLRNYVLEKGLEEDLLLMPNFTELRDKDWAVVPPTSLAAPATMAVVAPRRLGRQTLSSEWASPSHHRCPCHRPGCCCLPSNLVAVAIALAAVANARFVARHPRPPLSPSPSPSPSSSPSPLLPRHHLAAVGIASLPPATLITIAIALATLTLALFVARQPRHHHHRPAVAITIAIALVAINHLPPSLPLLLPPKPLLSSSHSTLVDNAIARFIPLTLFVTLHPYPHQHCLVALTLFITCSHAS